MPAWTTAFSRARAAYGVVFFLGAGFGFARQVLYAAALPPAEFGSLAVATVIGGYLVYLLTLGLSEGLLRQYSFLTRDSGPAAMFRLRDQVLSRITAFSISGMVVVALVWVVAQLFSASLVFAIVLAAVALAAGNSIFNVSVIEVRARREEMNVARVMLIRNTALCLAGVGTAAVTRSFLLAAMAELLTSVVVAAVVTLRSPQPARVDLRPSEGLKQAVRDGWPFTVSSALRNFVATAERWSIGLVVSLASVGAYAFSGLIFTGAIVVMTAIGTVLEPRLVHAYANGEPSARLLRQCDQIALVIGVGGAVLGLVGTFCMQWLIGQFFPLYHESIPLIPFVVVGSVIYCMNVYDYLMVAFGAGRSFLRMYVTLAVGAGIVLAILVALRAPLIAFAAAFVVVRVATLVATRWTVGKVARSAVVPPRPA